MIHLILPRLNTSRVATYIWIWQSILDLKLIAPDIPVWRVFLWVTDYGVNDSMDEKKVRGRVHRKRKHFEWLEWKIDSATQNRTFPVHHYFSFGKTTEKHPFLNDVMWWGSTNPHNSHTAATQKMIAEIRKFGKIYTHTDKGRRFFVSKISF